MIRILVTVAVVLVFTLSCKQKTNDESVTQYPEPEDRPNTFPPEMEPYREKFDRSALDYISIEAKPAETQLWQSKFLGIPYMPKGYEYPHGADKRPLQLLAQINFEDIPSLADFPSSGLLQFYISPHIAKNHVWGAYSYNADPWDPDAYFASLSNQLYFKVLYHDNIVKDSNRLKSKFPTFPDGYMPISSEAALTFTKSKGHVTNDDFRFPNYYGKDAFTFFDQFLDDAYTIGSQYYRFTYPKGQAWIGGYGVYTQGDPKEGREKEDWVLLLEIDSSYEFDLDILWGDAGVGTFFIRRDDLQRKDFSKVIYYWDNH